jgi:hypothetical protein
MDALVAVFANATNTPVPAEAGTANSPSATAKTDPRTRLRPTIPAL